MQQILNNIIHLLNTIPSEYSLILEFAMLFSVLLLLSYHFGKLGVYAFIILTMIIANLQVLKIVSYSFYPEPIALGKLAICFTFLGVDLIAECFGRRSAYKGVFLGFIINVSFILLMIITVGYKPAISVQATNFHEHLKTIFTPAPGIFLAGVIAFIASQLLDITLFLKLKEKFQGRLLGIRYFLSVTLASLIDNIIFYTLALYIFNNFVDLKTLIYSYILGTLIFRVCIIALSSTMINVIKNVVMTSRSFHEN